MKKNRVRHPYRPKPAVFGTRKFGDCLHPERCRRSELCVPFRSVRLAPDRRIDGVRTRPGHSRPGSLRLRAEMHAVQFSRIVTPAQSRAVGSSWSDFHLRGLRTSGGSQRGRIARLATWASPSEGGRRGGGAIASFVQFAGPNAPQPVRGTIAARKARSSARDEEFSPRLRQGVRGP